MEYSFDSEYPKRNRGRPKLGIEVMRPDFKIFQFDGDAINIRTNQHNKIITADSNDENKSNSNSNEGQRHIAFDGKKAYNNIGMDDLVNLIIRELKLENVELYKFEKKDIEQD